MHYIDRGMHSHANQANDHKRATKLSECKCWNMSSNTEASQQNGKTGFIAGSCLYLPLYTVREVMYIKGYISTTQNSLCNKSSFSVFWSNLKKPILPCNFSKLNQSDRHAKIIHCVMYCEIYEIAWKGGGVRSGGAQEGYNTINALPVPVTGREGYAWLPQPISVSVHLT